MSCSEEKIVKQIMTYNKDSDGVEKRLDSEKPNLKGDYKNVVILFFLYVLQGDFD